MITSNTIHNFFEDTTSGSLQSNQHQMLFGLIRLLNKKLSPMGLYEPSSALTDQFHVYISTDIDAKLSQKRRYAICKKYALEFSKFFKSNDLTTIFTYKPRRWSEYLVQIDVEPISEIYILRWCCLRFRLE